MESLAGTCTLFLTGMIYLVRYADTHVLVRATSPVIATLGKEPLSLECSYKTTGSDVVLSVNWFHKMTYGDTFRQIAQIPNGEVVHIPQKFTDQRLASKGKIYSLIKGSFKVAKLEINPSECTDEGTYECKVQVLGEKTPHKAKVQVHLNDDPKILSLSHNSAAVVEGHPVTFTCTASLGRPVGSLKWLVYTSRNDGPYDEMEMVGVTSFSKIAGSCSPIGTSTLAIIVSRTDQTVKCVVQQHTESGLIEVTDAQKLDVKYRVRDTVIYAKVGNIHMPVSRDIVVKKGANVYLTCRSLANPRPTFQWRYLALDGGMSPNGPVTMSSNPEQTLRSITSNQSGSYICDAFNYISNRKYTETRSVRIMVKDQVTGYPLENPSDDDTMSDVGRYLLIGGVVTGALLFTVFVSLLSVMCVRRCSQKQLVHQMRYSGLQPKKTVPKPKHSGDSVIVWGHSCVSDTGDHVRPEKKGKRRLKIRFPRKIGSSSKHR